MQINACKLKGLYMRLPRSHCQTAYCRIAGSANVSACFLMYTHTHTHTYTYLYINVRTNCLCRLKEAQLSVRRITGEKKVETRKINPNSLVRNDSLQEIFPWLFFVCGWKHTSKHKHHFLSTERAAAAERSQLVFTIITNVEQTGIFCCHFFFQTKTTSLW